MFSDVPRTMRSCSGSSGWCQSLAATLDQYSSLWSNVKLSCRDVCMNGKGKEEICIEDLPKVTTENVQEASTVEAT